MELDKFDIDISEIKKMSLSELENLSQSLRNRILSIVSNNGGHLASNLGIVEATIVLHKLFDSPNDKIIFDVGHQCYAHKILTGRANKMDYIRKFGGISGFINRQES